MNKRALSDIDTKPTDAMVKEATQGLEWRQEYGRGGTMVGISRARDIKNKKNLSISVIKRMYSFFKRHEIDKKAEGFRYGEEGYPSNGRIAWALWGGDAGFSWSSRKVKEIEREEERKLSDKIMKGLENKVEEHNEEVKDLDLSWNARVTLSTLEEVFSRGVGAFKTNPESVRPSIDNADAWAYARVNSFLYALKKGKYRSGKHDTDLLPKEHPVRKEMDKKNMELMEKKELRHIQKIEETEDSIIIHYGKSKDDVEMIMEEPQDMPMEESMKDEDEYKSEARNIPNKEVRTFNVENLELRMDGDIKKVIGYGAVFNSMSNDLGGFREIISKNAFEDRLEDDVRFLVNHDGLPLARTTNNTLRLSVDEKGLRYEAIMPDTTLSNDLMELMKNGTISQSSFAFIVEDDSWEQKDGVNIRTINKVSRLFDVSAVTYPAYEEASSSVALRSLEDWKEKSQETQFKENFKLEQIEVKKEMQDLHKRNLAELKLKLIK